MKEHWQLAKQISETVNEILPIYGRPSVPAALQARQYVIDTVSKTYGIPKTWVKSVWIDQLADGSYWADFEISPKIEENEFNEFLSDCDKTDS